MMHLILGFKFTKWRTGNKVLEFMIGT